MKNTLFILISVFFFSTSIKSQIKIGNNPQNINAASLLELESSSKTLVITSINSEEMNAITPSQGALVYNIDTQCIHYYNSLAWINLCDLAGVNDNFTTDPIVNATAGISTIAITPTTDGNNFEVALNSIQTDQIQDGGIIGADIQDNSITANKLSDDSVGRNELATNAVGFDAIDFGELNLASFSNTPGFLTAANIVSANPDNDLESEIDGVFFDQQPLLDAIDNNYTVITNHITADNDSTIGNEILNVTNGNTSLLRSGMGTTLDPFTIAVNANGITENEIADGAVTSIKILNKNVTPAKIQPASQDPIDPLEKMLLTDTSGNVVWADNPSTNLANTNLTQSASENRNYDLNGQKLTFSGIAGSSVGIGNFGGSQPVQSTDKLDVNGQIRARGGFAANPGSAGEPSYGFYTNGDTDTGMYRAGPDQIGISTNGTDAIRINASQNVGIGTIAPTSTLHTGGSFATAIDRETSATVNLTTNNLQHTIILDPGVTTLLLPAADGDTLGRIYILKNRSSGTINTNINFRASNGTTTNTISNATIVWLQSDGLGEWEQIN